MDFYQLIEQRESVRNYDASRKLDPKTIKRIINAGRLAPSASNRQPWKFLLVSSEKMLNKIRPCYHRDWFKNAPYILIIVGDKNQSWRRSSDTYNSIETDLAIAMDHLILAAENEGVGACWIIAYDYKILSDALNLKENEVVFSITPLGYQTKDYVKHKNKIRKDLKEVFIEI